MPTGSTPRGRIVRFGVFEVDLCAGELRKSGMRIKLHGQPLEVLGMLLQRPGEVIPREELRQKPWPMDTFVDFDHGVNTAINRLREALGDSAETPRFVETVPRRGYRFIGTVNGGAGNGTEPPTPTEQKPDAGEKPARQLGIGAGLAAVGLLDAGAARWNATRRKLWAAGLGLVGLCALFAVGFYWFTSASSNRPPRVLRYRQLTTDRQIKGEWPCGEVNIIVTDGPRVFFSEANSAVAQVSANGGDVVRIPTPFPCFPFTDISPDKTELLARSLTNTYAQDQPLWSLSIANGQPHRLGNLTGHSAAWSPDGQRIAYATRNDATSADDLYIATKDGSTAQKLIGAENGCVEFIRWSPDGKVLRMLVWNERSISLWEVSTDGTNLHSIDLLSGEHRPIVDMNWTPDGRYFLFTVGRGNMYIPGIQLGGDIWAVREAKSFFPKKAATPIQLTTGAMSFWGPTPSADGKEIFATGGQIRGELARYDLKSRTLEPYLSGISAEQLDFSKDGKWLTYVTFPEGILWRSKVDGTERRQLTNPPLAAGLPQWSPDGTRIAFSGLLPGGIWKIYVIPAEGGKPELVSQGERSELDPTWSEDGNSLIFGGIFLGVQPRIASVDLRTGRKSIIPGSEGMHSPRASPDNRFIVATDAPGARKLLLFDQETQKWSELMSNKNPGGLNWNRWSGDSKFVYVFDFADRHAPVVYRIRIADRKTERVAAFEVPQGINGYWLSWAGVAPDGSPLVLRDLSIEEIYALDVELP
jgi:Tol biopolymer transport system component/DNA-binding winged helix-turn-helix (wHTH) protein